MAVSYKVKNSLDIILPYDSAVALPTELKFYVYTETCTQMTVSALFIITPNWEQPRYPSIGQPNRGTSVQWNIFQ